MTTITKSKAAAINFAGKGATARSAAFAAIPALSFGEETSRTASLDNMRKVLGASPSPELSKAARIEYLIGRVAARLPVSELPRGKTSEVERLALARDVVCHMARAVEPGKEARPLRKGQVGRRSAIQQRVMRAAEEATSRFFADLGLTGAQTTSAKNAKNRAPSMAGSGKGKAKAAPAAPSHSQLVKPAAPTTADDVIAFVSQTSRMLQDYVNKHAKIAPLDIATAVQAFRGDVLKAANMEQERKAVAKAAGTPAAPAKAAKLRAVK